jgi:hypothetical protein
MKDLLALLLTLTVEGSGHVSTGTEEGGDTVTAECMFQMGIHWEHGSVYKCCCWYRC